MQRLSPDQPRVILVMFDICVRPWVPAGELNLAVPCAKFTRMLDNMDDSFLSTNACDDLRAGLNDRSI
jgi:hypothetical protein